MKNRAFTLVEIVLALGLVGFSMLAIFALVAQSQKTSRETRLEGVASLLAAKIGSQLRASSAWETNIPNYTDGKTLSQIAAGTAAVSTNFLNINLESVPSTDPDRQFAVVTRINPVSPGLLLSENAEVADALSSLDGAGGTVFVTIEISYPALAPEATRSKRTFPAIITRTSRD